VQTIGWVSKLYSTFVAAGLPGPQQGEEKDAESHR
jgi:hypothetical protein